MEYLDINRAIARVEQTGLVVGIPDDSTLAKLAHGASYQKDAAVTEDG